MAMSRISVLFDADTSGLTAGSKRATDALRGLGGEMKGLDAAFASLKDYTDNAFGGFGNQAAAARTAMGGMADEARRLQAAWQAGSLTVEQYRDGIARLRDASETMAAQLDRAQRVTVQFQSPEESHLARMREYDSLLAAGVLSQESWNRAAKASAETLRKETEDKAALAAATQRLRDAEQERAALASRAQQLTVQFQTPDQSHISRMQEYNALVAAGAISQETYERAAAASLATLMRETEDKAALAASTERLREAERERAAVAAQAAALVERLSTAEERHQAALQEASTLLGKGAIDYATYARAVADADRKLEAADGTHEARIQSQRNLDAAMREGRSVIQSVATAEERYASRVAKLNDLLALGAIDQRTFNRAVDAARSEMKGAADAAETYKLAQAGLNAVLGRLNGVIALQAASLLLELVQVMHRVASAGLQVANDTRKAVDQIDLLSKRTGQSAEALAALEFVGRQSGVGLDELSKATARADRMFVQASQGSKTATAAFTNIGLAVADLEDMNPEERFDAIAAAIAQLPTPAEQSAAAIAIFGRSGAELVPMFQELGGNLAAAREQAERLGFVLSGQQVQAIDGMNDAIDRAYMGFEGIVRQATAYLAPAIEHVVDLWTSFVENTGGANLGRGVVNMMLDGAEVVARVFDYVVAIFRPVWDYARQVIEMAGGVANIWQGLAIVFNSVVIGLQGAGKILLSVGAGVVGSMASILSTLLSVYEKYANLFGPNQTGDWVARQRKALDEMTDTAFFDMMQLGQEAGEDFYGAFDNLFNPEDYGFKFGDAATGTWEGWIEDLRAKMDALQKRGEDEAVNKINGASAALGATIETKLAGAVDARSKEGFKEMLRLMYGGRDNADERTANASERTAEATEEMVDKMDDLGVEAVAIP